MGTLASIYLFFTHEAYVLQCLEGADGNLRENRQTEYIQECKSLLLLPLLTNNREELKLQRIQVPRRKTLSDKLVMDNFVFISTFGCFCSYIE
jgi:hypothetical protein